MNKKTWIPKFNIYSKRLTTWQQKLWEELTGKPYMGIIDNVAGVRFYKEAYGMIGEKQHLFNVQPGRASPCKAKEKLFAGIQKSVSAFPYGTIAAAKVDSGLTTQIDRGTGVYDTYDVGTSTTIDCDAWGYAASGEGFHSVLSMGVMDATTYNDGGGTSRTIKGVYMTTTDNNCLDDDTFFFSIDGTSVSNSDTTWAEIDWDDISGVPQNIDRSVDITLYTGSKNGSSHWEWDPATPNWRDTDANTDFVLTTA